MGCEMTEIRMKAPNTTDSFDPWTVSLELSAFARLLQLKNIAPTEKSRHKLARELKDEWRDLDEWFHSLPPARMNYLNRQLSTARDRMKADGYFSGDSQ